MTQLNQIIDWATEKYDVEVHFASLAELREYGSERGVWGSREIGKDFIILVQEDLSELEQIITVSHELGHVINVIDDYKADMKQWNDLGWSPSVKMLREMAAWEYAVKVLHQVGFTNWDRFLKTTSYSIGTYYFNTWHPWTRGLIRRGNHDCNRLVKPKVLFLKHLKEIIKG